MGRSIKKAAKSAPKKTSKKSAAPKRKTAHTLKKVARTLKAKIKRGLTGPVIRSAVRFVTDPEVRPVTPDPQTAQHVSLPRHYGQDVMVLMARDPWWLFAYWEVTDGRRYEIYDAIQRAGHHPQATVLRVYDVTDKHIGEGAVYFEIDISFPADNWYVDVGQPDREWITELGVRTREGAFFAFVRSNPIRTPRYGVSDVLDEEWLLPDEVYWKIIGHSAGAGKGMSSADVQEVLKRYLRSALSSEGLSGERALPIKSLPKL